MWKPHRSPWPCYYEIGRRYSFCCSWTSPGHQVVIWIGKVSPETRQMSFLLRPNIKLESPTTSLKLHQHGKCCSSMFFLTSIENCWMMFCLKSMRWYETTPRGIPAVRLTFIALLTTILCLKAVNLHWVTWICFLLMIFDGDVPLTFLLTPRGDEAQQFTTGCGYAQPSCLLESTTFSVIFPFGTGVNCCQNQLHRWDPLGMLDRKTVQSSTTWFLNPRVPSDSSRWTEISCGKKLG